MPGLETSPIVYEDRFGEFSTTHAEIAAFQDKLLENNGGRLPLRVDSLAVYTGTLTEERRGFTHLDDPFYELEPGNYVHYDNLEPHPDSVDAYYEVIEGIWDYPEAKVSVWGSMHRHSRVLIYGGHIVVHGNLDTGSEAFTEDLSEGLRSTINPQALRMTSKRFEVGRRKIDPDQVIYSSIAVPLGRILLPDQQM
jgi:hypothetical protein